MRGRTVCLLGLALVTVTGAVACMQQPELPPDLELTPDPSTRREAPTTKETPATGPLTKLDVDAEALPTPPDGGFAETRDGGGVRTVDAGPDAAVVADAAPATDAAVDAGASYQPRCNGFLPRDRELENNDTQAKANLFEKYVCAGINGANDVDWFVVDTTQGLSFTFDPDDDAFANVTSPSGVVASSFGPAIYGSGENGRFVIEIHSPAHRTQTYLLVRR